MLPVPGIGSISGEPGRAARRARPARCVAANSRRDLLDLNASWRSGARRSRAERRADSRCPRALHHVRASPSSSRAQTLYGLETVAISVSASADSSCSRVTLLSPSAPISPPPRVAGPEHSCPSACSKGTASSRSLPPPPGASPGSPSRPSTRADRARSPRAAPAFVMSEYQEPSARRAAAQLGDDHQIVGIGTPARRRRVRSPHVQPVVPGCVQHAHAEIDRAAQQTDRRRAIGRWTPDARSPAAA